MTVTTRDKIAALQAIYAIDQTRALELADEWGVVDCVRCGGVRPRMLIGPPNVFSLSCADCFFRLWKELEERGWLHEGSR